MEYDLSERLRETFGVAVSGIDIGAIELDKSSEGYRHLMGVTKELAGATAKAEAEARIRDIHAKQRIEAEHYEDSCCGYCNHPDCYGSCLNSHAQRCY